MNRDRGPHHLPARPDWRTCKGPTPVSVGFWSWPMISQRGALAGERMGAASKGLHDFGTKFYVFPHSWSVRGDDGAGAIDDADTDAGLIEDSGEERLEVGEMCTGHLQFCFDEERNELCFARQLFFAFARLIHRHGTRAGKQDEGQGQEQPVGEQ